MQAGTSRGAATSPPVDPDYSHFYCVSPDAPTNPVIYWMGHFDPGPVKFRLEDAAGPFRLDLGDTIYAPNILQDSKGRNVLWAWVQEHRTIGSYDFAGCMATPRVMLQRDRRLVQQPLPELAEVHPAALFFFFSSSLCSASARQSTGSRPRLQRPYSDAYRHHLLSSIAWCAVALLSLIHI